MQTLSYSKILLAILPLVAIGLIHRQISKNGAFLLVWSNLPITILHELAHYSVALLLGGKPTGFSLWPQRDGKKWRLGSVTARVTYISAAPTALAPLLWFFAGLLLIVERDAIAQGSLSGLIGVYLAAYMCVAASIPSWQDIKVALSHPVSLMLWAIVIAASGRLIS